jgi:hypothetical protein
VEYFILLTAKALADGGAPDSELIRRAVEAGPQ